MVRPYANGREPNTKALAGQEITHDGSLATRQQAALIEFLEMVICQRIRGENRRRGAGNSGGERTKTIFEVNEASWVFPYSTGEDIKYL